MAYDMPASLRAIGYAAQGSGMTIIALSVAVLDPLELAGVKPAAVGALRARGPYRWVRHPIYLGWVLIVFGAPSMPSTRLMFALVSTVYLLVAIPWEEGSMADAFGDTYEGYRRRVRWRILPGVW